MPLFDDATPRSQHPKMALKTAQGWQAPTPPPHRPDASHSALLAAAARLDLTEAGRDSATRMARTLLADGSGIAAFATTAMDAANDLSRQVSDIANRLTATTVDSFLSLITQAMQSQKPVLLHAFLHSLTPRISPDEAEIHARRLAAQVAAELQLLVGITAKISETHHRLARQIGALRIVQAASSMPADGQAARARMVLVESSFLGLQMTQSLLQTMQQTARKQEEALKNTLYVAIPNWRAMKAAMRPN